MPPPFRPFWSVKYLSFGQKLPIWTAHHTSVESRHPEVTKIPYYIFSLEDSQKKVSAHGLIGAGANTENTEQKFNDKYST